MSKLTKYNQFLITTIGTVLLMIILISAYFGISEMIRYINWSRNDQIELSIVSSEEAEKLSKDSTLKQLVSFEKILLIDSTKHLYIIPSEQVNLSNKEKINDNELLGLTSNFSGGNGKFYYGDNYYNNLLLYDDINNSTYEIFSRRVSINSFQIVSVNEKNYLLIELIDFDSNKDGYLNSEDLKQIALFNFQTKELVNFNKKATHYIIKKQLHDSNKFVISVTKDRNLNGEYDYNEEPLQFHLLDVSNGKLKPLFDEELILKLQKKLDGRLK